MINMKEQQNTKYRQEKKVLLFDVTTNFALLLLILFCSSFFIDEEKTLTNQAALESIENFIQERKVAEATSVIEELDEKELNDSEQFTLEVMKMATSRLTGDFQTAFRIRDSILSIPEAQWPAPPRMNAYFFNICGILSATIPQINLDQAEHYFNRAIDILEQQKDTKAQLQLASTLDNIGKIRISRRDYISADTYIAKAFEIAKSYADPTDQRLHAIKLSYATIQSHLGFLTDAKSMFEDVLHYYKGNPEGFEHNIATVSYNLGNIAFKLQNFEDAIALYQQATNVYEALYGDQDFRVLNASSRLASSLLMSGEFYSGRKLHDEILDRYPLASYEDTISYGEQLVEIAADLIQVDHTDGAISLLERCIRMSNNYPDDPVMNTVVVSAYSYYTQLLIESGHLQEASVANWKHEKLSLEVYGGEHYGLGYSKFYSGLILSKQGFNKLAHKSFDEALRYFTTSSFYFDPFVVLEIYIRKANLTFKDSKINENVLQVDSITVWIQKAEAVVQDFLNDRYSYNYRHRLRSFMADIAALKAAITIGQGDYSHDDLYQIFESSKSKLLLDYVIDKDFHGKTDGDPSHQKEISRLKTLRIFLEEEIKDPELDPEIKSATADSLLQITERIKLLSNDQHQTGLPVSDVAFDAFTSLAELKYILGNNEIFVHYILHEDVIYAMTITQKEVRIHTTPAANLERYLKQFKSLLKDPESNIEDYQTIGYKLYQLLLAPLGPLPADVVISPIGPLNGLPFEALITEDNRSDIDWRRLPYVLNEHNVSYALSGALKVYSEKIASTSGPFHVIVPGYQLQDAREESETTQTQGKFSPLLFSRDEARRIRSIDKLRLKEISDAPQLKSTFIKAVQSSSMVHFAGHAYADDQLPRNSFLLLDGDDDYSYLKMHEIATWTLPLQLISLSACQTSDGLRQKGEGVASMTRAFTLAGCKSILSTFWPINDLASADIMYQFYNHLADNTPKAEALRKSKLTYIHSSRDIDKAHPFFWSSYVVFGSNAPLLFEDRDRASIYYLFLLVLLIVVALFFWFRRRSSPSFR